MEPVKYTAVSGTEDGSIEKRHNTRPWLHYGGFGLILLMSCIASSILTATYVSTNITAPTMLPHSSTSSVCEIPPTRREWRSLRNSEKKNYLESVKCLTKLPSALRDDGTLYDDFVYVHMSIGQRSHFSASFLPWHRMFLHIFENTLIDKCGFHGNLPYWDWASDWQSLDTSSIWDTVHGFGGDGNVSVKSPIAAGNCVTQGPFSDLQLLFYNKTKLPHCLTRGFKNYQTEELGSLFGEQFKPFEMGRLITAQTYDHFREMIEWTVHNAMHWGVRGDFGQDSAANDPLFWLHHTQLDRLWWLWQQENPGKRLVEYAGQGFNTTTSGPASMKDTLNYTGVGDNFKVFQAMNTKTDILCYRY
ncbi:hypothetical protein BP6252_04450 [Coleophoma cylindrospora]|uniref:Tyrosinase copper-binding domain-containing protein n=1 Tax=Coleophoma cylindrospora TaxID=1849047 RepID=A0A3D8S0H6_9HELO|nr:hypothetical protein BP6252_04450 [Coleophoma cylindrospora]